MYARNLLQVTEPVRMDGSMTQELKAMVSASHDLGQHMYAAMVLAFGAGTILQWLALVAATYLFIIDRTNWRTNILTSLLVPYIALNIPVILLGYIRGEIGLWIAFVTVVLRLFFPKNFPSHLDLPASLILLLVVAPGLVVGLRFSKAGNIISVGIGGYLLYENIIASGGFKKAFAERGVPVTIGILLLFVSPLYLLIKALL